MSRGCDLADIAAAIGLYVSDLFNESRRAVASYTIDQGRFGRAAIETPRGFIARETDIARIKRLESLPLDTIHVRSRDVNAARAKANLVFQLSLAPIARFAWEGYSPNDTDSAWPALFERALEECTFELACFKDLTAVPWTSFDRPAILYPMAADRAAAWLRSMPLSPATRAAA